MQLPGREQFAHVIFAPQAWSGYEETYFPGMVNQDIPGSRVAASANANGTQESVMPLTTGIGSQRRRRSRKWQESCRMQVTSSIIRGHHQVVCDTLVRFRSSSYKGWMERNLTG